MVNARFIGLLAADAHSVGGLPPDGQDDVISRLFLCPGRFKVRGVNSLLMGLLSVLAATNQISAASNLVARATGISVAIADPHDPVEKEYQKLLEQDDEAQAEADRWIRDNQAFREKGAGVKDALLSIKVEQRLEPVQKSYADFLARHPKHTRARLAFGSFLYDIGKEDEAVAQWEKARELDPKNPAAWNNLANYYGHRGPITNAFQFYEKAIELNPQEAVYHENYATTLFLFRKDAMELYHLNEQQVFDRALELYRKALQLDPGNFLLANDLAQTYYGIRPPRLKEAMEAWHQALKLAKDDLQREGVYIHLARNEISLNRFQDARQHLQQVTNAVYLELKQRLERNLAEKQNKTSETNSPPTQP